MFGITKKFLKDLVERALWTAAEAVVAVVTTEVADLDTGVYAPLIATGLAVVKGFIAKHVGNKESASTAPGV